MRRVLATLDVAPELLGRFVGFIPNAVRIIGSEESPANGAVRFVLDVTATGKPGGEWTGIVKDDGASRIITFGPAT